MWLNPTAIVSNAGEEVTASSAASGILLSPRSMSKQNGSCVTW